MVCPPHGCQSKASKDDTLNQDGSARKIGKHPSGQMDGLVETAQIMKTISQLDVP